MHLQTTCNLSLTERNTLGDIVVIFWGEPRLLEHKIELACHSKLCKFFLESVLSKKKLKSIQGLLLKRIQILKIYKFQPHFVQRDKQLRKLTSFITTCSPLTTQDTHVGRQTDCSSQGQLVLVGDWLMVVCS